MKVYEPRKTAESTGMFPPTPTPRTATKEARATKLGDPPAAIPNMLAKKRVRLKDHLSKGRCKTSVGEGCCMFEGWN